MAEFGGTAASSNYNITPQDLQYLQAMLTHEGQNTILNDLNQGNTDSAYGQIAGLTETWLNRAMSAGTGIQQQMLAPAQLTGFSAANVPNEAATLDPRINAMLGAYLQGRSTGDAAVMPNVNQYLNTQLVAATPAYGTAYKNWYNASSPLGAFGDLRGGGRSSLQQEFLSNPNFGGTPDYGVSLGPGVNLSPSEGDVNAYADFRNNFRANTPFPPARPIDGSAGIDPRAEGQGNVGGPLDQFSNALTGGLERAGNAFGGAVSGFGNALNRGLGNVFGSVPQVPQTIGPFGAITAPPQFGLPADFGAPQAQGVDTSNLFGTALPQADPNFGAPNMPGVNPNAGFNPGQFLGGGLGAFGGGYGGFNPFGGRGFGGLPAQPVSAFGAPGAVSANGFDGVDAGALSPTGVPTQAAPPAFNPFGSRGGIQAFGGGYGAVNANPLGFYGLNVPTLGFNGTDAATLGPGQSVTATDLAPAPAPAFNPFGSSRYGGFGAGLNLGAFGGAGNQSFGSLYGIPSLPASTDAGTLGPDQTAQTLSPDASANPFGFNGASASPLGFGGAQVMPFGGAFGGFNARTFGFGGANVPAFGFGGTSAPTLGFNGPDSPAIGPDQFATALAPATPAFNPFGGGGYGGFGGRFNPGGFGGVGAQSFSSLFGVPAAPAAPAAPAPSPFGFSGGDVSGFDPNAGGAPAAPAPAPDAFGGGSLFGSGFNSDASENAFLRGQMADNYAKMAAGQAPAATNPNVFNQQLAAMTPPAPSPQSFIAQQPNYAPAPGFSAPVSFAAPQIALQMPVPSFNFAPPLMSGGGFGVGFL